jgi:hypothetical protein
MSPSLVKSPLLGVQAKFGFDLAALFFVGSMACKAVFGEEGAVRPD